MYGTRVAFTSGMHKENLSRQAPWAPPVATLRLTRGSSAQAVWVTEGRPGASPLTIGSDPTCDWAIRAANVPARALYILVDERGVYAHSGPEGQVRFNGRQLGRAWRRVKSVARFDIGLARIEIEISERLFLAEPDAAPGAPTDPDQSGVRPSFLPRPVQVPTEKRRSLRERLSRNSPPEAATVLDRAPRSARRWWRYVLAALGTACAYFAWLLVLDG
jgi:hypothetical protein